MAPIKGGKKKHLKNHKNHTGSDTKSGHRYLRTAQSDDEIYATVCKSLGGNKFDAYARIDGKIQTVRCSLPGKFLYNRNKHDNLMTVGKWILLGVYTDYSTPKYEVLEVYNDVDVRGLKSILAPNQYPPTSDTETSLDGIREEIIEFRMDIDESPIVKNHSVTQTIDSSVNFNIDDI